ENDFSTDLSSPIPNFALYKKTDDGAYFWTMGGIAGGATLAYKDSIPLPNITPNINFNDILKNTKIEGSNMYAQTTIGKAYNLTNKWSSSIAFRSVFAKRTLDAKTTLFGKNSSIEAEREATGFGGQFGLNYTPNDKLNIGFRYDTKVNLNFKTKSKISDNSKNNIVSNKLLNIYPVYKDGLKTRRDLPALAALGASYKVTNEWTTFIGGNYYFNESATMDRIEGMNVDYKNGWEISLGSEYWLNSQFAWLVGFNYADTGAPDKSFAATEYALDSSMVGTGVKYKPNETTEWTVAFNHYFYDSRSVENIKYEKEISSIGVNFVKKF
ncbi:MAG: OmpP1/FadL family transporter, partial [Cetobacterium sp.]